MAGAREGWRELIRQAVDYLEVLRQGGFCCAEGKVGDLPTPAMSKPAGKKTPPPGKPTPSSLSPGSQEALKAVLAKPLGQAGGPAKTSTPAPTELFAAAKSSYPTPPPARAPFVPASASLPPLTAQPARAVSKVVTLRDRAEGIKTIAEAADLERLRYLASGCQMCGLAQGRTLAVCGEGNPRAELMFVGEGPGYHEDVQGKPFVGRAGALLTEMIRAMGLTRDEVYITNIVKCRPPGNRDPEPDEIRACEPYLKRQIALIRPKVICALGRISIQGLLRDTTPISKLRGTWRTYGGIPLMPTFHPAFLLRDPSQKRLAWEDLKAIMAKLAEQKKNG